MIKTFVGTFSKPILTCSCQLLELVKNIFFLKVKSKVVQICYAKKKIEDTQERSVVYTIYSKISLCCEAPAVAQAVEREAGCGFRCDSLQRTSWSDQRALLYLMRTFQKGLFAVFSSKLLLSVQRIENCVLFYYFEFIHTFFYSYPELITFE